MKFERNILGQCVYDAGRGPVGGYWASLEAQPPSWPYRYNERVRNSNAIFRGHQFAVGGVPYVVA